MYIGFHQASVCASYFSTYAKKTMVMTIYELDRIRRDPEAFQKMCLVAYSIFKGFDLYHQTNYFPKITQVLDLAQSFDFYGFCRLARYFLHPYMADRIDECALLDELEIILCNNWQMGDEDLEGNKRDHEVHQFAQEQLHAFLDQMVENDQDLRTETEVQNLLHNWFQDLENVENNRFNLNLIDLHELKIPLKRIPFLEGLGAYIFVWVDIGCIPLFLQDWSLIDLSDYADRLGQFRVLSWIPSQSLDEWIRGSMCAGFIVQALDVSRCILWQNLQPEEQRAAKWQIAASTAEFLYNLSILQKRDIRLIVLLAFIAKSLGVMKFVFASKPHFFEAG